MVKDNTDSILSRKLTLFNLEVFRLFIHPGEVVEVRIPKIYGNSPAWGGWARGTVSGYFDDHESFCKAVQLANKTPHNGIYFTLQVIDPRLIARAFNRLKMCDLTTSDANVWAYRWLPVDIDPVRPSGVSSSNSELQKAMVLREAVSMWAMKNFGFPSPIRAMSGNGAHLLFRLPDIPANKENQLFIKHTLEEIAAAFKSDEVNIDTTVFNPARIWKLYGTTSKKGDYVPQSEYREERPYREAHIDSLGDQEHG